MDNAVTQLKVEDEEFLVASLIDRCPKTMMLRELVQNAVEAAANAAPGDQNITIDTVQIDGGAKLRIRNTGTGMDAAALYSMCDIASSIGKLKGLDKNFGMGAKVASLPSNNHGVRYRSCAGGRVHEVIIGKRNGVYGRILRPKRTAGPGTGYERQTDILDVTAQAREEGLDLSRDWTEVVLLGMRPDHNTAFDPYDGDPGSEQFWLPDYLYNRYFRIPEGIELDISADYHWRPETAAFHTISQRAKDAFAHYDCVTTADGLKIHYFYDPTCADRPWENLSSEGAIQTAIGQVALVFRDEIYDRKIGSPWAYDAPMFGVTFGARNTSVFIELPDAYPLRPDTYRQFLMSAAGTQQALTTRDFAKIVRASRPAWLLGIIEDLGGSRGGTGAVIDGLAKLSHKLNLSTLSGDDGPTLVVDPQNSTTAEDALGFDIVLLRNEQDINDRWLRGRAACFYQETMQLFVNTQYTSVNALKSDLQKKFEASTETPELLEIIKEVAIDCLVTRVGRALIFAISKHLQVDDWQYGHVEKAMSPEALSIAGDDCEMLQSWAEQQVQARLALGAA